MSEYPRTFPARLAVGTDVTETADGFIRLGFEGKYVVLETSGSVSISDSPLGSDAHLMLSVDEVDELISDLIALRLEIQVASEAVAS